MYCLCVYTHAYMYVNSYIHTYIHVYLQEYLVGFCPPPVLLCFPPLSMFIYAYTCMYTYVYIHIFSNELGGFNVCENAFDSIHK